MSTATMPIIEAPNLDEFARDLVNQKIGLQTHSDQFVSCTVSLTPWELSKAHFQQAVKVARALSLLFRNTSQNTPFLLEALADFSDESSLVFQLKRQITQTTINKASCLNLSRQDLLLDDSAHWRLVESNSIAAGMSPFCESLKDLLIKHLDFNEQQFAPNPALEQLSRQLYTAAYANNQNSRPLIIFVVAENEDNIHDQQKLMTELENRGAWVMRKTFAQLSQELVAENEYLKLQDSIVDCFYFRTGYNLSDYHLSDYHLSDYHLSKFDSSKIDSEKYLALRTWIEQHQVVVAPSMRLQLATSKWVQMKLSQMSVEQLQQTMHIDLPSAKLAKEALKTKYHIPNNQDSTFKLLSQGQWILKTQNEGGGNVQELNALTFSNLQSNSQLILMEKINAKIRMHGLSMFKQGEVIETPQAISELGILTLGENHEYGGYLLRSKPANQLETGVHQAGGALDTLIFTD